MTDRRSSGGGGADAGFYMQRQGRRNQVLLAEPLLPPGGLTGDEAKDTAAALARLSCASSETPVHKAPSTLKAQQAFNTGAAFSDRTEALGLAEGRAAEIVASLEPALERERQFELRWYQLVLHKVWRRGGSFSPLFGPQGPPPLNHEDEWLGELPWPNGVRADRGFFPICIGFCQFIWRQPAASKMAKRSVWIKAGLGALPVVFSTIFSFAILHVQQASVAAVTGVDNSEAIFGCAQPKLVFFLLCVLMAITAAAKLRLDYQFQIDVPLAGIRFHVRHVLQRFLLNLHVGSKKQEQEGKPPIAMAARLTPSACAQVLDPLVFYAVNQARRLPPPPPAAPPATPSAPQPPQRISFVASQPPVLARRAGVGLRLRDPADPRRATRLIPRGRRAEEVLRPGHPAAVRRLDHHGVDLHDPLLLVPQECAAGARAPQSHVERALRRPRRHADRRDPVQGLLRQGPAQQGGDRRQGQGVRRRGLRLPQARVPDVLHESGI